MENQGPPRADKLVIKFIKDNQTMMAALQSGSIDIATDVPAIDMLKFKNNDQYTVLDRRRWGIAFWEMNTTSEILKDIDVRKAVNMAINKNVLVKSVLQEQGEVAHTPLSPSLFGYDPASEQSDYKYSPEEAKKRLEASGWKENAQGIREKNGKTLTLPFLSTAKDAQANQSIQSMLKEIFWVPLYADKSFTVVNNRVHGVKLSPMYGYSFQDSWVEEK